MLPTVLNAQQDPTDPWSLTLDTIPLSLQSNESGIAVTGGSAVLYICSGNRGGLDGFINTVCLNSDGIMSANWLSLKATSLQKKKELNTD
jgi:hypothetical protein